MINTTKKFIIEWKEKYPDLRGNVLEVGSLDVNGNVKDLFGDFESYIGSDMRAGANVDVVVNGHELVSKFDKDSFDLVICLDTLEHDDKFWLTVEQMKEVLRPGGFLIICVPSIRHPRHNHPSDYYRFFESSFSEVFFDGYENTNIRFECYANNDELNPDEILGWGRKPK